MLSHRTLHAPREAPAATATMAKSVATRLGERRTPKTDPAWAAPAQKPAHVSTPEEERVGVPEVQVALLASVPTAVQLTFAGQGMQSPWTM